MWINAIKVNGQLENTYIYTEKETLSIGILKYVCSSNINRFLTYSSLSLKLKLQPAKIRSVHDWGLAVWWIMIFSYDLCNMSVIWIYLSDISSSYYIESRATTCYYSLLKLM